MMYEANEATQTHCYNPVAPAYLIWAYYVHGQHRCQEDPVSLLSGRLEKTTGSSPHHVAQHCPTWSETTTPYAPRSSRFGSEPPSVKDNVDVRRYTILSCMPETTTMMHNSSKIVNGIRTLPVFYKKLRKVLFRFNIRQQQCFHKAYTSVHGTLDWQKPVSARPV